MKQTIKSVSSRQAVLPLVAAFVVLGTRVACAVDYPTTILNDHPVAYYRLEEPNGSSTVADSSGNDFIGYVTYVTQADGTTIYPQLGQPGIDTNSALFATSTGVGQGNIDVPWNATINPVNEDGVTGAPFSAEVWVQATTQPGGYEVPLDDNMEYNQPPPYGNSAGWNFYQTPGPNSTWSFSLRPTPGFVGNGPAVTLGQWTHLVLTYDGTNAVFYVNGVAYGTYANPTYYANPGIGPASDLLVGEGPNTGQIPYDGYVDEIAVYNYALSAAQVENHYEVGTNSIRVLPTPPSFNVQPVDTNTYAGIPVTFTSQAVGSPTPTYQWTRVGSGPILNATNNTYTITPVYPGDDGAQFYVTASNSAGNTNSDTVTLTVETNLNVVYNPFSITRRVGGYAAFRVVANGALPITYQWHSVSNSVDRTIAGATSDTLWLSNIQPADSGTFYYADVANPYTSAESGQASLTVIARTSEAPTNAYSTVVMADHPVAFWRLDEKSGTNALDTVGSFDGMYSYVGSDLTYGYPSGVPHDDDTMVHITNTAIVTVPYALELNPVTGPWSYEFWIQPTSLDPNNFHTPISSEANPNMGANLTGWNIYQHVASVWTWNIFNGGSGGSFTSEFVDNPIVAGTWYYMVLTDDGTNMNWYSNGRLVLTESVKGVGFVQNGINGDPNNAAGPLTIGVRSDGVFGDWDGGVGDVAVYNYVLSPQQIQNHFLNTTRLTAVQYGSNVVITWGAGTLQSSTNVAGPYIDVSGVPTSPYTNSVSAASHLYYRAQLQ
ncbi:MAG TPA: LamG-like jellyroll fold domain-containing protein [Candidatus Saccharimonadales bacterium]|nr:LamG-like jellyroll fold domain-containing protein [Candidatus Saccharimonadales bacterium]